MSVGPQTTSFSGMTRGYHFTSPVAFNICGLFVPTDASSGTQDIRVVRFTAGAPPAFAATTLSYVTLLNVSGVAPTTTVSCNISVAAGDIIGIYGSRSTTCINSYGNTAFVTSIMGFPTTLNRSGTQNCISTVATWPLPIWSEAGNIGRIFMYYNCCPTPTITALATPTSACAGASVAILGGGATTYTWMPGGMNTASIVVSPTATTNYTLSGSTLGCIGSKTVAVTVTSPTITINATNSVICNSGSTTLSGAGASTYTWSGGITNGVVFTPTVTNTYTVIGTTVNGCTNTAVKTISVSSTPTLIVNSSTICAGQTATLTASGAITYNWSTGSTNNSILVSPLVTTNYTVTGISSGCSSTTVVSVYVIPTPTLTVNSVTLCAGQSATLTVSGATSYIWSTSALSNTIIVTPSVTTSYSVGGISLLGCVNSSTTTVVVNPLPIISINSPTICAGQTTTLIASGATTYTWSSSSVSNSLIITPPSSSNYTVLGQNLGCLSSTIGSVVVIPLPLISVNSATICLGQLTTLNSSGATTYSWSTGSVANFITVSPTLTTNYTVTGTATGCSSSKSVTVVVNSLPVLIASSATICSGNSTLLTVTGANTYTWIPNLSLSSAIGSSVTANPLATIVYTINGTSLFGCVNTTTTQLIVVSTPTLNASVSPTVICLGDISNLSALGASNYLWSPGGETISTPTVSPSNTTVYTVVGSNINGVVSCSTSTTVTVNVIQPAVITAFGSDSICIGKSTAVYASGGNMYSWQPNSSVSNPTGFSTNVTPTTTTIYTVTGSTNGVCPGVAMVQIFVNPKPIIYAGVDTVINIDESYILQGTGDSEIGFLPQNGIPLICNFCSSVEVNPQENTCYTLKGENGHGCVSYDEVCIKITKDWNLYVPNAFTPNEDGVNELFSPVGYGLSEIKLTIFDRWGTQLFKSTNEILGWNGKFKGKVCEPGVYVYKVEILTMVGITETRFGHLVLLTNTK